VQSRTLFTLAVLAALQAAAFPARAMVPRKAQGGTPPAKAAGIPNPPVHSSSSSSSSSTSSPNGSASGSTVIPLSPATIKAWQSIQTMPGFASKWTLSLGSGAPGAAPVGLTVPRALGNRVLVGTRAEKAGLLCLRAAPGLREGLVQGHVDLGVAGSPDVPNDVESVLWLHPTLALAAHGGGRLTLVHVGDSGALSVFSPLPRELQEAEVRDMAGDPKDPNWFAVGGYAKHMALICLEDPDKAQFLPAEGTVSSVRWSPFNQGVCPSFTREDGVLSIYDVRTPPLTSPAIRAAFGRPDLFAHERVSDHHILLGFGNGEILTVDWRKPDHLLGTLKDPFVIAIGDMAYDARRSRLLVSGIPDLTVYDFDPAKDLLRVRCHFHPGAQMVSDDTAYAGTFLDDGSVFAGASEGFVTRIDLGAGEAKDGAPSGDKAPSSSTAPQV